MQVRTCWWTNCQSPWRYWFNGACVAESFILWVIRTLYFKSHPEHFKMILAWFEFFMVSSATHPWIIGFFGLFRLGCSLFRLNVIFVQIFHKSLAVGTQIESWLILVASINRALITRSKLFFYQCLVWSYSVALGWLVRVERVRSKVFGNVYS